MESNDRTSKRTSANTIEIIPQRLYWISDKSPPKSRTHFATGNRNQQTSVDAKGFI